MREQSRWFPNFALMKPTFTTSSSSQRPNAGRFAPTTRHIGDIIADLLRQHGIKPRHPNRSRNRRPGYLRTRQDPRR
jgi:hypothetical protein